MTPDLIMNAFIIALLSGTIMYTFILNRKLSVLRQDRRALENLLQNLVVLAEKTELSTQTLRAAAQTSLEQVEAQLKNGRALRDDLSFLLERSEKTCQTMTTLIDAARGVAAAPPRATSPEISTITPLTSGRPSKAPSSSLPFDETPPAATSNSNLLNKLKKLR